MQPLANRVASSPLVLRALGLSLTPQNPEISVGLLARHIPTQRQIFSDLS